jgi:predicted transcriptional regulator
VVHHGLHLDAPARYDAFMRTTVDLDPAVLDRAKRLALSEGKTLGSVLNEALAAYLGKRKQVAKDPPFDLLVCGRATGRFPSAEEIGAVEEAEELEALRIPGAKR